MSINKVDQSLNGFRNSLAPSFVLFLAIATSGIPFFYWNEEWIIISLLFTLLIYVLQTGSLKLDKKALLIICLFVIWEVLQFLFHGGFRLRAPIGTFGRLFYAYLIVKVVGEHFVYIFQRIIFFFACVSLVMYSLFYVPNLLDPLLEISEAVFQPLFGLGESSYTYRPNFILFNFHGIELEPMRNSGPFWEPGAFSVYLNLAIGFEILRTGKFRIRKNLVFIIALLTTLSTAGYAVFFFLISSSYFFQEKYKVLKYFFVIPLIVLIVYISNNISFLSEKLITDIALATSTTTSRFGSALADITLLSKHPIIGYGRNEFAMYGTTQFLIEVMHRNNGLTKLLVQWGAPLGVFFLFLIKKGFNRIGELYQSRSTVVWIVFVSFLISSFSQGIYQYPFFMSLMFWQFIENDKNTTRNALEDQ